MSSGKDLISRGWPPGLAIGLALDAAERLGATSMDDDAILRELEKVIATIDFCIRQDPRTPRPKADPCS